jgi:hypothetical protein
MWGYANSARDLLAPVKIGEKMLTKALPRHWREQFTSRGLERFGPRTPRKVA